MNRIFSLAILASAAMAGHAHAQTAPFPSDGCRPGWDGTNYLDADGGILPEQGLSISPEGYVITAAGALAILNEACGAAALEAAGGGELLGAGVGGAAVGGLTLALVALGGGSTTTTTTTTID